MRKLLLSQLILLSYIVAAQNIGIGTTTPVSKLHIFTGASGNTIPMGPLVVEGSTPTFISILTPETTLAGLAFGNPTSSTSGSIVYNSSVGSVNSLLFRTNGSYKMAINALGNVGIGNLLPSYRLQVTNGTVRIDGPSAFGGTALSIGGVGDVEVDANGIVGGRLMIKENGFVGIGTNNPAYQFDVANRMRLRSGGTNVTSAGIWLNNNANTEEAFMGMEDDTHVGFFGGAAWRFGVNTQTGALKVNGDEGATGKILQSTGSGTPAAWTNAGNVIRSFWGAQGGIGMDITDGSNWVEIPGVTMNINLAVKSRLVISATFTAWGPFCPVGCGEGCAKITLEVDGNLVQLQFNDGLTVIMAPANADGAASMSNIFYDVNAGAHTIKFKIKRGCNRATNNLTLFRCSQASIIAIPID